MLLLYHPLGLNTQASNPTALIPPLRPDRCTTRAVDFEAFVLIGNIIQSKTAAVFSGGGVRNTAAATSSKHVKDQTSLESGQEFDVFVE